MAYIDKINKNSTDYDLQDSKAARSVNGTTDSHVEQADEIYTTSTQVSTSAFVYRTTAGDVSIETGAASINYLEGNTVQTGHTDEVLDVQSSFMDSGTTVAIDASTWRTAVSTDGTYSFSYDGSDWKLNDATVTLATYGLTVTGTVTEGDSITVTYVALVIGTLATTTPTSFVATGFNQYDATAGYAHVVGNNQYRIAGTYTSLGFTTTIGGATTPVTVTDNKFTPTEDGYIYVTGASGDILIALVWSGTMDSEPYSAYSTSSITIPTADASSAALPTATYGMPSVGNVRDKLSFAEKVYVQNIGHYIYSAENLATVQALGVAYVYDLSDIFYVLPDPVTYTLDSSVSGAYTANDYGTEEFIGTTVPVNTSITYGNSLVDKLRNMLPIQSIGTGLTLTGTELSASGGGSVTPVQTTGQSTTDVMSQNATTSMVYADPSALKRIRIGSGAGAFADDTIVIGKSAQTNAAHNIAIGESTNTYGNYNMCIGYAARNTSTSNRYATAIGGWSQTTGDYSIALGSYSKATQKGQVDISTTLTTNTYGYNNSQYRLLTGLYDGQSAHDAATVAQGNTLATSAPTTATVGVLGQLYTDTTNMHTYQCTAIDDVTDPSNPSYTWTQRW